jgi:hypothetical protein
MYRLDRSFGATLSHRLRSVYGPDVLVEKIQVANAEKKNSIDVHLSPIPHIRDCFGCCLATNLNFLDNEKWITGLLFDRVEVYASVYMQKMMVFAMFANSN